MLRDDSIAPELAIIARIQSGFAETRERNRSDFPNLAGVVDMIEREFGKVRVIYASEGGKTLGKVPCGTSGKV
jgi:hypothetical protein